MLKDNNNEKNSKFYIFLAGLTFIVPLAFFYYYNSAMKPLSIAGIELKKISQEEQVSEEDLQILLHSAPTDSKINNKSQQLGLLVADTNKSSGKNNNGNSQGTNTKFDASQIIGLDVTDFSSVMDTTNQRILLMGDSECGGLCYQLNDYCIANGHKLVASFVWNSATIFNFAFADTITDLIAKYKPTYIFIVLGLNELYARDLTKRKQAAQIFAKKLEGIPYTWVGPANFTEDYGINKIFLEASQKGSFFLSKSLEIPKGRDKRHPNATGYRVWMDSLALWVENEAKYKIKLSAPVKRNRPYKTKLINLNAARYRGY